MLTQLDEIIGFFMPPKRPRHRETDLLGPVTVAKNIIQEGQNDRISWVGI